MLLSDLLRPFRRNRWLIIVPFVSIVLTVTVLTLLARPIYESKAAVYIGSNDQLTFSPTQMAAQKYLVKNQIPILKSRRLAAEVIRRFQKSDVRDSLFILGKRELPARFGFMKRLDSVVTGGKNHADTLSFIELVENFRDVTKVSEQMETNVILLLARSPSPWEASFIVNTWVDAYQEYDQILSQGDASESKRFLEAKLKEVETQLRDSENRLMMFQQRERVVSLNEETSQLVKQLSEFESQYNKTRTDLESNENQRHYLKNQLDESRRHFVDDILKLSSPVLSQLQQQMAQLVTEKAAYEAQLIGAGLDPERDGRLAQLESRLNGIREKIVEETSNYMKTDRTGIDPVAHSETLIAEILKIETTQQSLKAKAAALKRIVDEYNYKLSGLPSKSLQLAQLERDVQVNREIYAMLRQKFEEARIKSTGLGGNIMILDRGNPPIYPVYPRVRFNIALAILFGLILGIGLAFAKDYFEDYLWQTEEIEALKLKVIGSIPRLDEKSRQFRKTEKADHLIERARSISPYLITRQDTQSAIPEAYRVIRTYIHYKMQTEKVNTLLVTSPGAGEGKSTTVANLAIASAQKGCKTLLVDCDLRKPVQEMILNGISRDEGLITYLHGDASWDANIRETSVKRLDLMAAGAPTKHASEMLGSKRMLEFIKTASNHYQLVLFDCPPILPVTDAVQLSKWIRGLVLTVKVGATTRRGLQLALKRLQSVQAPVWGAIFTGVSDDAQYGYDAYYES
ncbi:polysaccharide biosynthesis tyrosine autokinase [bacterium]|nr:polysaccharide biosynthesis tyrosine autokinase [bacterium]